MASSADSVGRAIENTHDAEQGTIAKQVGKLARVSYRFDTAESAYEEGIIVWWLDFLWGLWNGFTAWIVLIGHVFGAWDGYPFYNAARSGNWYDFGFLLGAGSPLLGFFRGR